MPAKNPRLTITLEPLLAAQLRRLSELTGNSQSKLISEILDGSTAVFARVIEVLEAAKSATDSMKGKAAIDLEAAQSRVEAQLGLVLGEFEEATAPLLKGVETVTRRARKRTEGGGGTTRPKAVSAHAPATVTPPSNRGVRSTANPRQKQKKRA